MGKKRASNNQILDALQAFQAAYSITNGVRERSALSDAASSNSVTESVSGDDAAKHFEANYVPQEGGPATAADYLKQNPDIAATLSPDRKQSFDVGSDSFNTRGEAQRNAGEKNTRAMADVYSQFGKPEEAQRLRQQAIQTRGLEQNQADSDELRNVLSSGNLSVSNALAPRNEAARSSISTGADITGASSTPEHTPPLGGTAQPVAQSNGAPPKQEYDLNTYMKTMAPRAVQTMLKQGRVQEAKQFTDFIDSEEGRSYAKDWITGVRKHAIGDSAGALADFEKMYNSQLYNDGHTVKMTPLEDGKKYRIDQISADGQVLGSQTGEISALANQAASALSPMSAVKFHAEQQAQREKEGALLDRQIQIKQIDAQRDEYRQDRQDERLVMRLNAPPKAGGLTLSQERGNAEIDAAREAVAGMDPDEIRKRTAKQTNTGRENPDFDPSLESAVRLAGRRKVGADDAFGGQVKPAATPAQKPATATAIDRSDVAKRFRSERSMDGYTLGKETPDGVEVLSKGKVIGHYR